MLSIIEDPIAQAVIASLVYPPILRVRDYILPDTAVGVKIRRDFAAHYKEAVSILREDPELLTELVRFMTAMVPLARALSGEPPSRFVPPLGITPSTYTATRFHPSMVDWMNRLLERFRAAASPEMAESIRKYQQLLPEFSQKSPEEIIIALRQKALTKILESRPSKRAARNSR